MPKGEAWKISWEDILVQLEREYLLERLVRNEEEIPKLKKGDISLIDYATTFTEKQKLVSHQVPTKSSEVERFASLRPTDFSPMMKLATDFDVAIRIAKSLEDMIKGRTNIHVKLGRED